MRTSAVIVLTLALSACGSAATTSTSSSTGVPASTTSAVVMPAQPSEPQTLEADAKAAQEMADRSNSGDYAGTWMMFTPSLRDRMTQAEYVQLGKACGSSPLPIKIVPVRMEPDGSAIVRLSVGDGLAQQVRTMRYVEGTWQQEPGDAFAAQLGKPIAQIISAMCPGARKTP